MLLGHMPLFFFNPSLLYSSANTINAKVHTFLRQLTIMHILPAVQLLAVLSHLLARGIASPIAWPEEKLEAINALRARGTSEVR